MTLEGVTSLLTAAGVMVAAWQLMQSTRQARTDFEDDLAREYRDVVRSLPVGMLLGEAPTAEQFDSAFPSLLRYIDICNEQVFLRMTGRISDSTWRNWCDGIKSTIALRAFSLAWNEVKARAPGRFDDLRRLESSGFDDDPVRWISWPKRLRMRLLG